MARLLQGFIPALLLCTSCFSPAGGDSTSSTDTSGASTTGAAPTTEVPTTEGPTTNVSTTEVPTTSTAATGAASTTGSTGTSDSCSDGMIGGDETDIDCGGSCSPCAADQMCLVNTDCASMACLMGACLDMPACHLASDCPPTQVVCHEAACVDFACVDEPLSGLVCDDGLVCTLGDKCSAGVCTSSAPKPIALVDLADPTLGLRLDGPVPSQLSGTRVFLAGDFNKDAEPDLIVVTNKGSGPNVRVYVVFGGPTLATVKLEDIAAGAGGGVLIEVDMVLDVVDVNVAALGDFNKDGFHDLLIGTPLHKTGKGAVHVVFGKATTAPVKLSALPPSEGLSITGNNLNELFGYAVAGLGDLDKNGYTDFAVSAPSEIVANIKYGAVYVVYGSANLVSDTLANYVSSGGARRIQGPANGMEFGGSLAAGDMNGDKLVDLAVYQRDWIGGPKDGGRVLVFFMSPQPVVNFTAIDPLPQNSGFIVTGSTPLGYFGATLAGAGDFNGDGLSDLVIGGGNQLGRAVVVLGNNTLSGTLNSTMLVTNGKGFIIAGPTMDYFGTSVAGGLDTNGDGRSDLVVGSPAWAGNTGRAYVVFGRQTVATIQATDLAMGIGGFAIDGEKSGDLLGGAVGLTVSMNDDALADILLGARGFDVSPNGNEGRSYLVYGGDCHPTDP